MKKITLFLLLIFLSLSSFSQQVKQTAAWPAPSPDPNGLAWTITGTFNADPTAFEASPILTSNFAFDDDDAGNTSDDTIAAESPIIDLTDAIANGETRLEVSTSYTYNDLFDTLVLEYYDAEADAWILWDQFLKTEDEPEDQYCSGGRDYYASPLLNIAGFTATQQTGFKYRIRYDDEGGNNPGWRWGFCFDAPTIRSAGPPRTWYLQDVVFSNGTIARGTFDYDAITQTYFNFDINTFDSPQNGDVNYGRRHPTSEGNQSFFYTLETNAAGDLTGAKGLSIVFENPLPADGGTINIDPDLAQTFSAQAVCVDATCSQRVSPIDTFVGIGSSGYVTTIPQSQPETWYLNNVRFTNGAIAYGSFVFDPITQVYSDYDIKVLNSPDNGDTSYGEVPSFSPGNKNFMFTLETIDGDLTGVKGLSFVFEGNGLTTAGGTVSILQVQSSAQAVCQDATCSTRGTFFDNIASNSSVTTTPPPPLTWYMDNVVLSNGATATGSFDYEVVTNTYSNINITVHNSTENGTTSYGVINPNNVGDPSNLQILETDNGGDLTGIKTLSFRFNNLLPASGGVIDIAANIFSTQGICSDATCSAPTAPFDFVEDGSVTTSNTDPTITSADEVSTAEGLTFAINVESTDTNGDSEGAGLSYSISAPDSSELTIDTDTGEINFVNSPDFDNPTDENGDNIYDIDIIVTDSGGATDIQRLLITVIEIPCEGGTTTWTNGSWDNGTPDNTMIAIINEDVSIGGGSLNSFSSCALIINASVIIENSSYISIENHITVNTGGSIFVGSEASIVQVQEDAETINNGAITVQKITPEIEARNFFAMSSPMSAETRDGVYASSRAVFGIIPSNFVPYDIDLATFPEFASAENFLDDNNDYLDPFLGNRALPNPGIGTLVFPSPSHDSPLASYTLDFTEGTLNSGIISVPINYNGPATTNNYNLLGNPYASAIDVTAFLNANDAVNEVYYWDHITDPTADLPGFGTSNFSMNDISMRNAMMGLAAVNGGSAPAPFMASGQGFGIKADQTEMVNDTPVVFSNSLRVTGNNDDFRASETITEIDKLWLNLTTPVYEEVIAQTAIGFTPDATPSLDKGYDSKRLGTFLSLFTNLNGEYLGIQGREAFDSEMELQLGFSTTIEETVTYTIGIDHLEGIHMENTPVFLIDHQTNTISNLKENAYTFTASKGIQPERFTVVFEERDVLNIGEDSFRESDIKIYPNPAKDLVTISYAGNASLEKIIVTDLNGRLVKEFSLKNFNQSKQLNINTLTKGVYFLQIISSQDTAVKKLIVK